MEVIHKKKSDKASKKSLDDQAEARKARANNKVAKRNAKKAVDEAK